MKWPELTAEECMEIFKKYDMSSYEYYHNNMYFFGFAAVNYARYLKEKHEPAPKGKTEEEYNE